MGKNLERTYRVQDVRAAFAKQKIVFTESAGKKQVLKLDSSQLPPDVELHHNVVLHVFKGGIQVDEVARLAKTLKIKLQSLNL